MFRDTRTELQRYLSPGEKLLWDGKPKQGLVFRRSDFLMIPFSLMWGGFAVFWEIMALTVSFEGDTNGFEPGALIFSLFGVPFVLIGLYLIFGRFWADARRRKNTTYGITNERIIILSGRFSRKNRSVNLRTLSDISLTEKPDRSGTIWLGPRNPFFPFPGYPIPGFEHHFAPSIELIENAKDVYDLITAAQ